MVQYRFLKDYVYPAMSNSRTDFVKVFKAGDIIPNSLPISYMTIDFLEQLGFIEEIKSKYDEWEEKGIKSSLANVIIAPEDYVEEDKKYFTWDEAMEIKKKLGNGWRLPTRKEWTLICEEFACNKKGILSGPTLTENLGLSTNGFKNDRVVICESLDGYYWSGTAATADSNAYRLRFNSVGTYPSNSDVRWHGFSVRLVKTIDESQQSRAFLQARNVGIIS